MPNGTDAVGFPVYMTTLKTGTYMYEFYVFTVGNYTAIVQAEIGTETIEEMQPFIVEKPHGYPTITVATDS